VGSADKKQSLMESGFESESFGKLSFMKDETSKKERIHNYGLGSVKLICIFVCLENTRDAVVETGIIGGKIKDI